MYRHSNLVITQVRPGVPYWHFSVNGANDLLKVITQVRPGVPYWPMKIVTPSFKVVITQVRPGVPYWLIKGDAYYEN